jgi:hypothetical protein
VNRPAWSDLQARVLAAVVLVAEVEGVGLMPAALSGYDKLFKIVREDAARPSMMGELEPLQADPTVIFRPLNIVADDWQEEVLRCNAARVLLLCSRQSGKSMIMSVMALLEALLHPYAEVLIISRSIRQSTELLLKTKMFWRGLIGGRVHRRRSYNPKSLTMDSCLKRSLIEEKGWDQAAVALIGRETVTSTKDRMLSMELPNGSRITSLPGNPDTIVGFSAVTLLIIDEGSRVSDALYNLVRPFLSATEAVHGRPGRMVVASTPFGKRGWFYEAWNNCEKADAAYKQGQSGRILGTNGVPDKIHENTADKRQADVQRYSGADGWLRGHYQAGGEGRPYSPPFKTFRVTADQCPRIPREFLDEERAQVGDRWFRQEYECSFESSIDSVFSHDLIHSMVKPSGEGEWKAWFE